MKLKRWLALPLIIFSLFLTTPISASAETYYNEFYYNANINGYSFDNIALVSVYKRETSPYIDLVVTIENTYTPELIASITGQTTSEAYSSLLGLWYSDDNGVVYNPNECEVVFWCADLNSRGERKFNLQIYENWTYNCNRAYWTTDVNEIAVGDKVCCLVKLLDGVNQSNVTIFGQPFSITAPEETTMAAPEMPVETINVVPEPVTPATTAPPATVPETTTTTTEFVKRPAPVVIGVMDSQPTNDSARTSTNTEELATTTTTTTASSSTTTTSNSNMNKNVKRQVMNTTVTTVAEPEQTEEPTTNSLSPIVVAIISVLSLVAGVIIRHFL